MRVFRLRRVRNERGPRASVSGEEGATRAHPRSTPASAAHCEYNLFLLTFFKRFNLDFFRPYVLTCLSNQSPFRGIKLIVKTARFLY